MTAYVIVDIDVHDPVGYDEYKNSAAAGVYGGKYIARSARQKRSKVIGRRADWSFTI
jgi:uncharacterized protein (DUF1330 family)